MANFNKMDESAFLNTGADLSAFTGNDQDLSAFLSPATTVAKAENPNTFESGLGRGIDNMQANMYKTVEEVANLFGAEDIAKWGAQGYADNMQEVAEWGEPIRLKDVDGVADFGTFLVTHGAGLLPMVLGYTGAAIGGTLLGGPVGGLAATAAFGGSQNVGDVATVLKDKGEEEFGLSAWALAGGMTALDVIGIGRLAKPFTMATVKRAVLEQGAEATAEALERGLLRGGMTKGVAKEAAIVAVFEATASAGTAAMLEIGASEIAGVEVDHEMLYNNMKEAALLGGLAGAGFGTAGGYIKRKQMEHFINGEVLRETGVVPEKGVIGRSWDILTGNVMAPLAPKVTQVEKGRSLYNTFNNRFGVDLEDTHRIKRGEQFHSIADVESQAKAAYGRKWKKVLADKVKNNETGDPIVARFREHMDAIANEGISRKLMSEESKIEGYIPADLDYKNILAKWDEFKNDLTAHGWLHEVVDGMSDADIATANRNKATLTEYRMALEEGGDFSNFKDKFRRLNDDDLSEARRSEVYNELISQDIKGEMGSSRVGSRHGNLEGARAFDVPQSFYNKWALPDKNGKRFWNNIKRYSLNAAHRFAGEEHLGKNGEKLNKLILETQEQLINEKNKRLTSKEIEAIYKVVDAYDGSLGRIEDKFWGNVSQVVSTGINVTLLPLVTPGSFVEIFNIAAKTDMSTMVNATMRVGLRAGYETARRLAFMPPSDKHLTRATQMSQAGQTLYSAHEHLASRLTDANMSDVSSWVSNKFFKWSGLTLWTQALRNVGAEAMKLQLRQDLETIRTFPNTAEAKRATARMSEVGLTPDDASFMLRPQVTEGDIVRANNITAKAISMFNRKVAMEPSFADRPLWMSNHKMWMLSRLQGYPTMFTNTVLPMLGRKLTDTPTSVVDGLFIMGGVTFLGGLQMGLRDAISGREIYEGEDMMDVMYHSMKRNLAPKPIAMIGDIVTGVGHRRSAVETAFGPVATQAGKGAMLAAKAADGQLDFEGLVKEIAYMTTPAGAFKAWWE